MFLSTPLCTFYDKCIVQTLNKLGVSDSNLAKEPKEQPLKGYGSILRHVLEKQSKTYLFKPLGVLGQLYFPKVRYLCDCKCANELISGVKIFTTFDTTLKALSTVADGQLPVVRRALIEASLYGLAVQDFLKVVNGYRGSSIGRGPKSSRLFTICGIIASTLSMYEVYPKTQTKYKAVSTLVTTDDTDDRKLCQDPKFQMNGKRKTICKAAIIINGIGGFILNLSYFTLALKTVYNIKTSFVRYAIIGTAIAPILQDLTKQFYLSKTEGYWTISGTLPAEVEPD